MVSSFLGFIFGIFWLNAEKPLIDQWSTYINPLNQIFLFLGGVAIASYSRPARPIVGGGIAIGAFILFWLYPVSGDRIQLVTGLGRFFLSLACFAFVWATYVTPFRVKGAFAKALSFLGESSFSIYLMHPLVAALMVFVARRIEFSLSGAYFVAAVGTLVVSYLTFKYIETPMMRAGSTVANSLQIRQSSPA